MKIPTTYSDAKTFQNKIFWIIQIINSSQHWVLCDISWQLFHQESNTELFHFFCWKCRLFAILFSLKKSIHLRTSIEHLLGTFFLLMKRDVLVTWSTLFSFAFAVITCLDYPPELCSHQTALLYDCPSPIAQMADIGFKVVLLERLNQKWKQKHF